MAPKRRRSEGGPQLVWRRVRGKMESEVLTWNAIQSEPVQVVSRAVRALLELPETIVKEILRLVDTGRYLEHSPISQYLANFDYTRTYLPWAGTNRMANKNRILHRFGARYNLILGRWSGGSYGEGRWIHDR